MFHKLKCIKSSADMQLLFISIIFMQKKKKKLYLELKNIFNVKENNFISVIVFHGAAMLMKGNFLIKSKFLHYNKKTLKIILKY